MCLVCVLSVCAVCVCVWGTYDAEECHEQIHEPEAVRESSNIGSLVAYLEHHQERQCRKDQQRAVAEALCRHVVSVGRVGNVHGAR